MEAPWALPISLPDRLCRGAWQTTWLLCLLTCAGSLLYGGENAAETTPVQTETWDYATAARETLKQFTGTPGVVIHLGDSITVDMAYGQWPLKSPEKTPEEKAILQWMHCGKQDTTDGWWLATKQIGWRVTHTAASGVMADEFLKGGKNAKDGKPGLAPLDAMIKNLNPQMAVLMLGTNDAWNKRKTDDFIADMTTIVAKLQANGTVVILSSIPPHIHQPALAKEYNERLYALAKEKKLPYLDFYGEILKRRPGESWNGTLLGKGDVHPTDSGPGEVHAWSKPTAENLANCGYLLRAWLTVHKIMAVKEKVLGQ